MFEDVQSSWLSKRQSSKLLLFLLCLMPFIYLVWAALTNNLGPDPAQALADASGEWTLRMLLLTLALTPLRQITGSTVWVHYRRMAGLFAFFYALFHLLVYLFFLLGLQWQTLWEDVLERPYIAAGSVSLLLMLPLAITSTQSSRQRLGRRWKKLHRLVFAVAVSALVHLWWQVRSDATEALLYTMLFALLMLPRLYMLLERKLHSRKRR